MKHVCLFCWRELPFPRKQGLASRAVSCHACFMRARIGHRNTPTRAELAALALDQYWSQKPVRVLWGRVA